MCFIKIDFCKAGLNWWRGFPRRFYDHLVNMFFVNDKRCKVL